MTPAQWYAERKQALEEQLQKRFIDTLAEQQVQGEHALVFDQTRRDFPGHFERTVVFARNDKVYRVV